MLHVGAGPWDFQIVSVGQEEALEDEDRIPNRPGWARETGRGSHLLCLAFSWVEAYMSDDGDA